MPEPTLGRIAWADLALGNAGAVRDLYREVVGWTGEGADMGGYSDCSMISAGAVRDGGRYPRRARGELASAAGVPGLRHRRGSRREHGALP